MEYSINQLLSRGSFDCPCGRQHSARLKKAIIKSGAINDLGKTVREYGGHRAFVVADENTFAAAGEMALTSLENAGIAATMFMFGKDRTEPDEKAIGSVMLHFDSECDILIGIGSGVINDICKIAARLTGLHYIAVGTAPSMDGYASSTSSVIRDGLKVSVNSTCPDVIIGDTDILSMAPMTLIRSGLGDMIAKYISICEWRIGHTVTGEYYCEEVAAMIRAALKKCVDNAEGIITRDIKAVEAVMEGLIISGIAADYAGVSRPVSGVEHYYSHIWDMRAIEFSTPWSLHGIQCGIGTLLALRGYEKLRTEIPDRKRAEAAFNSLDKEAWFAKIEEYLGGSAKPILANAASSDRYNERLHRMRLDNIISKWDTVLGIIEEELPTSADIETLLKKIGAPTSSEEIGLPSEENELTFRITKDIRDKYILSTLMFDMGI